MASRSFMSRASSGLSGAVESGLKRASVNWAARSPTSLACSVASRPSTSNQSAT